MTDALHRTLTGRDEAGRTSSASRRQRCPGAALAGIVRVCHRGREYAGWYRVAGNQLTLYCGVASNSGVFSALLPSPTPLAERLLRDLIRAEHPGLDRA